MRVASSFATILLVSVPMVAQAQTPEQAGGAGPGLVTGAITGAIVGGPVGAVIGGAVGAIAGGVLAPPQAAQLQQYVAAQGTSSVRVQEPIAVGEPLPGRAEVYAVPPSAGVQTPYGYTVVNERLVLVDPRSRRIVQIVR